MYFGAKKFSIDICKNILYNIKKQYYDARHNCIAYRVIEDDKLIDYGCGKGRVAFYLNNELGCKVRGLEYAKEIYNLAIKNLEQYGNNKDISFINTNAEDYKIDEENVLRTLAIFKIACPNSSIRLAGGKKARLSQETIEKAFKYCVTQGP